MLLSIDPPRLEKLPSQQISQKHLAKYWNELSKEQRVDLLEQIAAVDFHKLSSLYSASDVAGIPSELINHAASPAKLIPANIRDKNPHAFQDAERVGWEALRDGRVGVILVAGGEGTRLGFPHPKGEFPIGPVSNKSLYQLLAEQVVAISRRADSQIPYYVMTSDATNAKTIAFYKENNYFGLDPANVRFFRQGNMPAVDQATGEILMASKDRIAFSPDGHGGLLEAMSNANLFNDLRQRQIELLFYHQVDNPLTRVCDPAFLGFHLIHRAEVSTKVVTKQDPDEKVGLLIEVDGRHHMIEYSDLPAEVAKQRGTDGRLRLHCGNIAVHLFQTDFLKRMTERIHELPYHRSRKKVPYINQVGELVQSVENNAYKFERFIFDIFPSAERPLAMEVVRDDEFVPLKNAEGPFSPEDVRQKMCRMYQRWLQRAGWTNEEELRVEIPAMIALNEFEFLERQAFRQVGIPRR